MQYIIFFDKIVVTYVNERSILMKKEKVLKKYFGHKKFRDGQSEIIDNILESVKSVSKKEKINYSLFEEDVREFCDNNNIII